MLYVIPAEAIRGDKEPWPVLADALAHIERAGKIRGFVVIAVERYGEIIAGYVEIGSLVFYARLAPTKDGSRYVLTLTPTFSTSMCYCGEV